MNFTPPLPSHDPLLVADAEQMLHEMGAENGNLRLELANRNSIIDRLYRHVKTLEAKLAEAEQRVSAQESVDYS